MAETTRSHPLKNILFKVSIGALVGLLVAGLVSVFRILLGLHFDLMVYLYHLARQHLFVLFVILIYYSLTLYLLRNWLQTQPEIAGGGGQYLEDELDGKADADWWPVLWKKFIGGLLIIPSGLILGRAGPSILIGAMLAKGLSYWLRLKAIKRSTYLLAGAVAGLTASFNLPIFALLFLLTGSQGKEVKRDWLVILSACLMSFSVVTCLFGQEAFLPLVAEGLPLGHAWTYLLYIGLGAFLGFARYFYERLLTQTVGLLGRFHQRYLWLFAIVGLVGYYWPDFLGGGYQVINYLASATFDLQAITLVLFVRFLLTVLSQQSGLPGGAFFPTLSLGAVLAVTVVTLLETAGLVPSNLVVLALILGMGAFWAANTKFPLLGMVLMLEMTRQLDLILPLSLTCLASYWVFNCLQPKQDEAILDEV